MIDYLRLSITDRCNFNCMYCAPLGGKQFICHDEVLRYEEIVKLTRIFVKAGIRKVRITGGEPLIKKNVLEFIKMLRHIDSLEELTLTTNGFNLDTMALPLRQAGIDRINISIDSLQRNCFKKITGTDAFDAVWEGIQSSLNVGFSSVKLNVVPMKTINDNEIIDFAKLTLDYPLTVRFIELFSTNESSRKCLDLRLPNEYVVDQIHKYFGVITPIDGVAGDGPAEYFTINGAQGVLGFISNFSRDFCGACTRMRVDCSGKISPCLFSGPVYDAKPILRNTGSEEKLLEDIKNVIGMKSLYSKATCLSPNIEMSSIGG